MSIAAVAVQPHAQTQLLHQQASSVQSLLSNTQRYVVQTPLVAAYVGAVIASRIGRAAQSAHEADDNTASSPRELAMRVLNKHSIELAPVQARRIETLMLSGAALPAEPLGQAQFQRVMRAANTVLVNVYGQQMTVTGWIPGYRVAAPGPRDHRDTQRPEMFTLTGRACPSCRVNPECYGADTRGSGSTRHSRNTVRCLNVTECGWWETL